MTFNETGWSCSAVITRDNIHGSASSHVSKAGLIESHDSGWEARLRTGDMTVIVSDFQVAPPGYPAPKGSLTLFFTSPEKLTAPIGFRSAILEIRSVSLDQPQPDPSLRDSDPSGNGFSFPATVLSDPRNQPVFAVITDRSGKVLRYLELDPKVVAPGELLKEEAQAALNSKLVDPKNRCQADNLLDGLFR